MIAVISPTTRAAFSPGDLFVVIPVRAATAARSPAGGGVGARRPSREAARADRRPVRQHGSQLPPPAPALADLAHRLYGHPSRQLRLVGVTGTDGKTSTTRLLAASSRWPRRRQRTGWSPRSTSRSAERRPHDFHHTTPEADGVQEVLREMADARRGRDPGSPSHALALDRVRGCEIDLAVFTNLSPEHLNFHGTMERVPGPRRACFGMLGEPTHEAGRASESSTRTTRSAGHARGLPCARPEYGSTRPPMCGTRSRAGAVRGAVSARDAAWGGQGRRDCSAGSTWRTGSPPPRPRTSWLGPERRAGGCRAAAGPRAGWSRRPGPAVPGRGRFRPHAPGAGERPAHAPPAHAGPRRCWSSATPASATRQPPDDGRIAAELSDYFVISMDDPLHEDPAEIAPRSPKARGGRRGARRAIRDRGGPAPRHRHAARARPPGDAVLLAGKGHEPRMLVGDERRPWNDRRVAEELLADNSGA